VHSNLAFFEPPKFGRDVLVGHLLVNSTVEAKGGGGEAISINIGRAQISPPTHQSEAPIPVGHARGEQLGGDRLRTRARQQQT